jgi:hypothetical protein
VVICHSPKFTMARNLIRANVTMSWYKARDDKANARRNPGLLRLDPKYEPYHTPQTTLPGSE